MNPADAMVFFGASGDLAFKKIYPALQAMVNHGQLNVPVVGVARSHWNLEQFKARVRSSLEAHGVYQPTAFAKLSSLLRYVDGDYNLASTYSALHKELGGAQSPLYYLAIPPNMFSVVANQLAASGCMRQARIVVEKPFGRDLASARSLNKTLLEYLPESSIFRIDHYLGKEPVRNLLYFRFANLLVEVGWDRRSIAEVQITMAESFGVGGRGKFYEEVGAIRDVVQSHMLQVLACLAMECPRQGDTESMRDEQARLLKAVRPMDPAAVIRGQYEGYRREPGVDPSSRVETFAATRLFIDNERWQGVPFFLRAGKGLATTATEVLVRFKCPERAIAADCRPELADYYRFRISPEVVIGIGARVKKGGESYEGMPIELVAHEEALDHIDPYERLLGDAAKGDPMLFTRQDGVEESWRIVEPVLHDPPIPREYKRGSWGPEPQPGDLAPQGHWHDPLPVEPAVVETPQPIAVRPLAEGARRLVARSAERRSAMQSSRGSGIEQP